VHATQSLHYLDFRGATLKACSPLFRHSVESRIFWFIATVACLLAFGFSFKQSHLAGEASKAASLELAKGQEKDNWLTCGVVWGVIFGAHSDYVDTLQAIGALILVWTAWRTVRRVAILQRHSR
jgi:hypothetical protein